MSHSWPREVYKAHREGLLRATDFLSQQGGRGNHTEKGLNVSPLRAVLFVCCIGLASTASAGDPLARSLWLTDYDVARSLARQSGKPLFVVFRCEH
jgi:hypothetical protein